MNESADIPPPVLPPPGAPSVEVPATEPPASDAHLAAPPTPTSRSERPILPWVVGIGFVVLAVAQGALWMRVLHPTDQSGATDQRPQATEQRLQAIEQRLSNLESRPAPATPAPATPAPATLAPATPAPATPAPATPAPATPGSVPPVPAPPDLAPLAARVTALEQRPATPPAQTDQLADRLAADEAKLASLEKAAIAPGQEADRALRMARVQAAFLALSAGKPLGTIPDAPPALARYATSAPSTEAALRLQFPAVARAALAAGHAPGSDRGFLARAWAEAQELITVRQGDRVVLGDPDAAVLAHAQSALDAADLAAAVADVGTLTGGAAQATAAWLDQARGLLAARAALADLAARG